MDPEMAREFLANLLAGEQGEAPGDLTDVMSLADPQAGPPDAVQDPELTPDPAGFSPVAGGAVPTELGDRIKDLDLE